MRSILLLVALCGLFFTACEPDEQPATFSIEVTPKTFNETVSPTGSKVMTASITNNSTVAGTVDWSFTETQVMTGWSYNVVANNVSQSGTTGSFELAAGASIDVTVSVMPNAIAGTGKSSLVFKNGSEDLETITYEVKAMITGPKFSLSTNSESGTAVKTAPKTEYKSKVKNLTGSDLNLTWVRINDSNNPGAWVIDVCDIVQCHIPTVNTYDITVPANGEFDLKIGFDVGGRAGTGAATVDLYETGDVGTTQVFTASHTATN
ncbi:MAG: hypothetical protein ACRBFS_08775 [Aureispira sp.]